MTATASIAVPTAPPPIRVPARVVPPHTTERLLDLIALMAPGLPPKRTKMLGVTANRIAKFKNMPVEQLPVAALTSLGTDFKLYLKSSGFKDATVRAYAHYGNLLRQHAAQLGLLSTHNDMALQWDPISRALGKKAGAATIIEYAMSINRSPNDFTIEDLRAWVVLMQRRGRAFAYVDNERSRFRRAMASCGFKQNLCEVIQWHEPYTVRFHQLPSELQRELNDLAAWKQAPFARGRQRGGRHRAVSAQKLVRFICQVYGFALTEQRTTNICSIAELITKERMEEFVAWFLNQRQRKAVPLRANLGLLVAAVKQYPPLSSTRFEWFGGLLAAIEEDDTEQEQRQQRKARRSVPYDKLAEVPDKICALRETGEKTVYETALLVMYEFLLRWWLALPWRQRNT